MGVASMPAAGETRSVQERLLASFMRVMLYAGAVFVLGAGIRAGSLGYVAFGALLLVAVARFGDAVDWGRASAWVFLAYAATAPFLGVYGWARASRTRAS